MSQYIDKSALVAEINRILNSYDPNEITSGRYALVSLRDFIDTLEAKEVDLDYIKDELDRAVKIYKPGGDFGWGTLYNIATHFFELGLNASNPLTWEDIKIILDIEIDILHECNSQKELVIKTYPKGEDYCGEILKRFKAQKGE